MKKFCDPPAFSWPPYSEENDSPLILDQFFIAYLYLIFHGHLRIQLTFCLFQLLLKGEGELLMTFTVKMSYTWFGFIDLFNSLFQEWLTQEEANEIFDLGKTVGNCKKAFNHIMQHHHFVPPIYLNGLGGGEATQVWSGIGMCLHRDEVVPVHLQIPIFQEKSDPFMYQ